MNSGNTKCITISNLLCIWPIKFSNNSLSDYSIVPLFYLSLRSLSIPISKMKSLKDKGISMMLTQLRWKVVQCKEIAHNETLCATDCSCDSCKIMWNQTAAEHSSIRSHLCELQNAFYNNKQKSQVISFKEHNYSKSVQFYCRLI